MAYRELPLPDGLGPHVTGLVRRLEDHYLKDVHGMLRLPAPEIGVSVGLNFAMAQVLSSVVSGVSVTLYGQTGSKGARFKGLLVDYYPWLLEPNQPDANQSARAIYSLFRNPLTHDLGLDLERARRTQKVVVKGLTVNDGRAGHTEQGVEALEQADRPKSLSPLLKINDARVVLLVEAFYWGVRRMLLELTADAARMAPAEHFLSELEKV